MNSRLSLSCAVSAFACLTTTSTAAIYIEDFSSFALGSIPTATAEYNAVVIDGSSTIGSGNALSMIDPGTTGATADKIAGFEVNFATDEASEYSALAFSFDLFNNQVPDSSSSMIFGLAGYSESTGIALNSTSARFFNLEFSTISSTLKVRTSAGSQGTIAYDLNGSNRIDLFVNDHETDSVSYERPDTAALDTLGANSMALFVNGDSFGVVTMGALTVGDSTGLGRFSFYSGSSVISTFTIDNLNIADLGTTAIPEPGMLPILLGLFSLGVMGYRRRR